MAELDLKEIGVRGVNSALHGLVHGVNEQDWLITNPMGQHAIACGLDAPLKVTIKGHVGFYCGGMNQHAAITIRGHAGVGVAENMMSGQVRVTGSASDSAGATGHGGLLVIEGNASSMSGYDVRMVFERTPMSRFSSSPGSIYPVLKRLERWGTRHEDEIHLKFTE